MSKITGIIKYQGSTLNFDGSTDIPLKAAMLYLQVNSNASKSDVEKFFEKGLRGIGHHFIEDVNNILPRDQNRFKTDEIELYDDYGNKCKYRISNQFRRGGTQDNLNYFIRYIETKGYSIRINSIMGYNLIDISKYYNLLR